MLKKTLLRSFSFVAGCAFMTLVVTAAVCGAVGGLIPGEDDDVPDRAKTAARPT